MLLIQFCHLVLELLSLLVILFLELEIHVPFLLRPWQLAPHLQVTKGSVFDHGEQTFISRQNCEGQLKINAGSNCHMLEEELIKGMLKTKTLQAVDVTGSPLLEQRWEEIQDKATNHSLLSCLRPDSFPRRAKSIHLNSTFRI